MADIIGHGMSEKCERHAEIAGEYYSQQITQLKTQVEVKERDYQVMKKFHDGLESEVSELKAMVNDLRENLSCMTTMEACANETGYIDGEGFVDRQKVLDKAVKALESSEKQSLKQHDYEVIMELNSKLKFPTMLRKMWSGGDVQAWLNDVIEQYAKNKRDGS